jgi:hypothetical protein
VAIRTELQQLSTRSGLAKDTTFRFGFDEFKDVDAVHEVSGLTPSAHSNCTAMVIFIERSALDGCLKRLVRTVNRALVQNHVQNLRGCSL